MPLSWQYWEYSFNLLICHTLNMTTSSALSKFFQYSHVSRMTASPARSRSSRTPVCAWNMHVIEMHRSFQCEFCFNIVLDISNTYSHVLDMATDLGVSFFQYSHVSHTWLGLDDTCRIMLLCVRDTSHSYVPCHSCMWSTCLVHAPRLIHMRDSFICVTHACDTWLRLQIALTLAVLLCVCVWHDSCICALDLDPKAGDLLHSVHF